MLVNADFHVHSCFSMASSKDMVIRNIAPKSKLKGLQLLGTGDGFHPKWLDIIEESTTYSGDGIYTADDMDFVLTTEVEGKNRIHHLIIIPDLDIAREMSEKLPSKNKNVDGRPKTKLGGAELLDFAHEYDCLIGPAHAFTPWTGMYKSHDSIYDCYQKAPDFVELGLSADTSMADTVSELKDFVFLTNSDAHSPWPHRLGREFNQIEVEDISYSSIKRFTVLLPIDTGSPISIIFRIFILPTFSISISIGSQILNTSMLLKRCNSSDILIFTILDNNIPAC